MASEIIDNILVSDSRFDSANKITILPKNNVLRGTEISIEKDGDDLTISIKSSNRESLRWAYENVGDLQATISKSSELKEYRNITAKVVEVTPGKK